MSERRRYFFILLIVCLMASAVWVVGEVVSQAGDHGARIQATGAVTTAPLVRQEGQFVSLATPLRGARPDAGDGRDLQSYYARRAYEGAPPSIPHAVDSEMSGNDGCSSCHEFGGWSPTLAAEAPRTPHPELLACRQCHVPQLTDQLFRPSDWSVVIPPALGRAALPGSPPPMPHGLQMRESCLTCHDGPSVARQLRTTHPERPGCLQCHVPQADSGVWERQPRAEGAR